MNINVNYHSSIKIHNIYVDPFQIDNSYNDAKYIFITHSHYDHYSISDIEKVVNKNTIFVCTQDVCLELKKIYSNKVIIVEQNKSYFLDDISFKTFASYNINKNFHSKENGWVGYVIELKGIKYAIIGDSDLTEEVQNIKCDVLFVPIGGTYTMDAKEAAKLVNIINPEVVIPVHYNGIVGNKKDEEIFLKCINNKIKYKLYV